MSVFKNTINKSSTLHLSRINYIQNLLITKECINNRVLSPQNMMRNHVSEELLEKK